MWRFALGRLLRYFSPPLLRDTLYLEELSTVKLVGAAANSMGLDLSRILFFR